MALPTINQFVDSVLQAQLLDPEQREEVVRMQAAAQDTRALAHDLLRRQLLTAFQINQIFLGKGATLNIGPFMLLERIGEGGMGQVYKAKQKTLNRIVALKVVRKECLGNPKVILRFQREIRAAGALNHPHIVRAYDADLVHGIYYIAMEFIEGDDLAKLVKDNGPLPVNQACDYIRQAALGLQHAFERGLVHRDLKPANLLVTRALPSDRRRSSGLIRRPQLNAKRDSSGVLPRPDIAITCPWGMLKILDMGLVRATETFSGQASTHLTQIGSVMGTPEFIAPEQARDSHTSDVRADLYSLGCTLFFLLTGQAPFPKGTLTEKLLQHQIEPPPSVAEVRRENLKVRLEDKGFNDASAFATRYGRVPFVVVKLISKLLAKKPEDRHQTPIELADDLQAILKRMADGTLADDETDAVTEVLPALPAGETEFLPPTDEMARLVVLDKSISSAMRRLTPASIVLASLGGLAMIALFTGIAILTARTNLTQAAPVAPIGIFKSKNADDPAWRKALKRP